VAAARSVVTRSIAAKPVLGAAVHPGDINAAAGADFGKAAIIEIVQAQFAAEHPELGGEIDTADPGADDRDRGVWHCRLLVLVGGARDRAPRQIQFARTVL